MMIKKIALIVLLALGLTGCGGPVVVTPDASQVAEIVAATLTAIATATGVPPTQMEAPSATPLALPSDTPTDTPTVLPTDTPTGTLTPTPVPTATLPPEDPRNQLGSPTWEAVFKDDSSWYTFEDDQSSIQVVDGELVMESFKANEYETWSLTWMKVSDFYMEMTVTSGDACQGKDRYGMMVRAPDSSHGYQFSISCDANFRVRNYDGKEFVDILPWQYDAHIFSGPNQTNRIGFLARGSDLSVYVNGHLLAEFEDDSYARGTFGVLIAASKTAGFTATVREVVCWSLD